MRVSKFLSAVFFFSLPETLFEFLPAAPRHEDINTVWWINRYFWCALGSLPRWPRCRKYSTLVDHGLPSSQSSTSPTQSLLGEKHFTGRLGSKKKINIKILRNAGSFMEKSKQRVVSFFCCCWWMRRCSWEYQVNISYLSVIHCFITFILLWLSRCSLLLLLLFLARVCQPGTRRAAGGGAARRFSEETCVRVLRL